MKSLTALLVVSALLSGCAAPFTAEDVKEVMAEVKKFKDATSSSKAFSNQSGDRRVVQRKQEESW